MLVVGTDLPSVLASPQVVVMEGFVKPGLANMEPPVNPDTGKRQGLFTACKVKVRARAGPGAW
jgi:hypothetical protein